MDLFGKVVGDLQENVSVNGNAITGTLKYVSDYNGFSSKVAERSGNYIVIHANVDPDATVTVTVTNPTVLDDDRVAVLRIADKDSQTITVVAEKDGYRPNTLVFNLSGLTCEPSDVSAGGGTDTSGD